MSNKLRGTGTFYNVLPIPQHFQSIWEQYTVPNKQTRQMEHAVVSSKTKEAQKTQFIKCENCPLSLNMMERPNCNDWFSCHQQNKVMDSDGFGLLLALSADLITALCRLSDRGVEVHQLWTNAWHQHRIDRKQTSLDSVHG